MDYWSPAEVHLNSVGECKVQHHFLDNENQRTHMNPVTAGNRLFKLTKNDRENTLNMFTFFGPLFEILNPLKIIYFNSDKM